jgi:hypothetical protein
MAAERVAPGQYDVAHDGALYRVGVGGPTATCECEDYRFRGRDIACKHGLRAAIVALYDGATPNSLFVARVASHARSADCPHGHAWCPGPAGPTLPCEGCIAAAGGDHWRVWELTARFAEGRR